jgi:hypothetical protein
MILTRCIALVAIRHQLTIMSQAPDPETLPSLPDTSTWDKATCDAYERLLSLNDRNTLEIRVIGQMLIQAPSVEGHAYVARHINGCTTEDEVHELGRFHLTHFVNYCMYGPSLSLSANFLSQSRLKQKRPARRQRMHHGPLLITYDK